MRRDDHGSGWVGDEMSIGWFFLVIVMRLDRFGGRDILLLMMVGAARIYNSAGISAVSGPEVIRVRLMYRLAWLVGGSG